MAAKSKFIDLFESTRIHLINEDGFVKKGEKSELPDMDKDEDELPVGDEPTADELGDQGEDPTPNGGEEVPVNQGYTNKEVDILNIALEFYRQNRENSIEIKSELNELFQNKEYDTLYGRMLDIADEAF